MRRLDKRPRNNVTNKAKDNLPLNSKGFNPQRKGKKADKQNKGNVIQCHECKSFRHIQAECSDFLRKQMKGYTATFLNDESDEKSESEQGNTVFAFISHIRSKSIRHNDGDSSGEQLSDDGIAEVYKMLYFKWNDGCKVIEKKERRLMF